MKRFLQKSYSWLATLLLTVAFAVSGSVAAQGIELPFAFTVSSGGTVDGVGFYMWSANWVDSAELYGEGDASATWGTINLTSPAKNIVKVELTCRTNSWSGVSSAEAAAATICETEDLGGSFTTNGAVAIWQGAAHKLTFSSTDDVDVYKMVVYLEEGEVVKECTVDVDHFADNCKPGKHEGSLTKYITLYMQENTATTSWTGSDNCPAEVTLTNEAGQQFPISQFNYWQNSDQIGITLKDEITAPGVYTLHIPEGIVPFESGKFNKEINVVWTVVEPDLRPTKDIVFDFAGDDTYTNNGETSFTQDGVGLVINENRYNTTANGFRIGTDGWLTFTAPEKATIKRIQLLQESTYGVSPDFSANVGEISVYEKTLIWAGDNASVTLTDNYGTCYFTKAIVTLAVEETEQPELDPNEACYDAWAALINGEFADIAYEYGYQMPEQDVAGKKPAAVAAPCVEYWANRTAFVQMGMGWEMVNAFLGQLYNTTIVDDYAYAQALLEAYNAAEVVAADTAEESYVAWKALVTTDMKAVKDEWVNYPEADVPGKKPAAVVKAVMEYYNNTSWLFSSFSGFGDDWAAAKAYYANFGTTIEANYAEALQIWTAYVNAEIVPEVVEPTYTEPVLSAADVSAEVAYYIYTDARGGLTVDGDQLKGTKEVGKGVDPTDVQQQFAFVNWNDNLYLYSLSAEKFIGKANRGNFTDEPVDPIYFKDASNGTVMLYFDDDFIFNLGGSNQVTIDTWGGSKQGYKDAGNSFKIMVAEKFDQTALLNKLAGGGEIVEPEVPTVDLNEFAGEWLFQGEGAYLEYEDWDGSLTPKQFYTVNMEVDGDRLLATGLVGFVYNEPNAFVGTYDAQAGTLTLSTPYYNCYVVDGNYEYYTSFNPLVLNVTKNEANQIVLSNTTGWTFAYEDWFYQQFTCGYTGVTMTKDGEMPELEPNPELLKFAGNYLFKGVNADSNDPQYTTNEYYDCEVSVYGDELHLTGFIGEVEGKMPYLVGKYDAENNRIKFSHPGADGGLIKAENGTSYYMDFFYVNVEGEEGEYVFDHSNPFIFYAYTNGEYTKCSYDSFKFIENGDVPEGWNHNILFPETANSIDDLLTYTLDFEEAVSVEAASADVLGVVFEASGNPYAIVLANGVFDVFGSVKFQGSKATVHFAKIADLNAQLQASAKAAAARIGGFVHTPGAASVVFASKSFKVDGELVYDMIQKDYEIAGEGAPTAIESIVTTANDSIYDLSGRRVKTAQSGLYIKNGVKVYMK